MGNSNHSSGFNSMVNSNQIDGQANREQMLRKLDEILETYTSDNVSFCKDVESVLKQLKRRRKEFDATRFFVLVVGPVKSGKSTLVNIFARKYVSPTAYKECTAIPTIIGKSNGGHLNKIIQYFPTKEYCSDEAQKETFDYIVDVIREVEDQDILHGRVSTKISDLTVENVKNIITLFYDDEKDKEELVVSIGIDGGGFIDDEIMLIDMPGLDGSFKHQDNTLVYSNMAQRADAVFFVQSTTSAINKSSVDFLKTLFGEKQGKIPVWLIHNIHDSQYFLKNDEKKKGDIKEQIEIGRRRVKNEFGITRFEDIILNLGKIYTAINEPERIKDESNEDVINAYKEYKGFETQLIKTLKKERQKIKDEINIGKAVDAIHESIGTIEKVVSDLNLQLGNIQDTISRTKRLSGSLDGVQIYDSGFLAEYDNLVVSEDIKGSWENRINTLFNEETRRCVKKVIGKDFNETIDGITQRCMKVMPTDVGTQFRTKLVNALCREILTPLRAAIDNVETILQELLNKTKVCINCDLNQLAANMLTTNATDIMPYSVDEKWGWGDIFNKKYRKDEQREYLDIAKSEIIEAIPAKLGEYKGIIKADFKSIRDSYISEVKKAIDKYAKEYEESQALIIETIKSRIELLNDFINDLKA